MHELVASSVASRIASQEPAGHTQHGLVDVIVQTIDVPLSMPVHVTLWPWLQCARIVAQRTASWRASLWLRHQRLRHEPRQRAPRLCGLYLARRCRGREERRDASYAGCAEAWREQAIDGCEVVSCQLHSPARALAATCSGARTPAMTVATAGCAASHASASSATCGPARAPRRRVAGRSPGRGGSGAAAKLGLL